MSTKLNFEAHGESDRRNSWYWGVLIKNYGTLYKAEQAVIASRKRVDPTYLAEKYLKERFWV